MLAYQFLGFACQPPVHLIIQNVLSISDVRWLWYVGFVTGWCVWVGLPIHFADCLFSIFSECLDDHVDALRGVRLVGIFNRLDILPLFPLDFLELSLLFRHKIGLSVILPPLRLHCESLIRLLYFRNSLGYLFLHHVDSVLLLLVVYFL